MTMFLFFFFNDTATTEIYTLSLHDALPIWRRRDRALRDGLEPRDAGERRGGHARPGVLLRRAGLGRGDARRADPRRAARRRLRARSRPRRERGRDGGDLAAHLDLAVGADDGPGASGSARCGPGRGGHQSCALVWVGRRWADGGGRMARLEVTGTELRVLFSR